MDTIKKIQGIIAKVSLYASSVLLFLVCSALFINVLDRFVLKIGFMWVEGFARYGLIWTVFLVANVLIYRNELMRVDFLDSLLPARFKKARERVYTAIFVVTLCLLTYFGTQQCVAYIGVKVLELPIDKFWVYLCIPVGSVLMLFQYLANLLTSFMSKKGETE